MRPGVSADPGGFRAVESGGIQWERDGSYLEAFEGPNAGVVKIHSDFTGYGTVYGKEDGKDRKRADKMRITYDSGDTLEFRGHGRVWFWNGDRLRTDDELPNDRLPGAFFGSATIEAEFPGKTEPTTVPQAELDS